MKKIGLDIYGFDNGIAPPINAAIKFAKEHNDVEIFIFGMKKDILNITKEVPKNIKIINSDNSISKNDTPLSFRNKPNSSLVVGLKHLSRGIIDFFISSNNSSTYLLAALTFIGTIKPKMRVAFASYFPTMIENKKVFFLDSGANLTLSPNNYLELAFLSREILKKMGIKQPSIGLLNNAGEANKGSQEVKDAYSKLNQYKTKINFIGNIEPRNILSGYADIILCNGWNGNIAVKSIEGTADVILSDIKKNIKKKIKNPLILWYLKKALSPLKEKYNPNKYGFGQLVGLRKPCIKVHSVGQSDNFSYAIKNAYSQLNKKIEVSKNKKPQIKVNDESVIKKNYEKILPLLKQFNIKPKNIEMYVKSLTHSSWTIDHKSFTNDFNYERLEHSGDKAINYFVTRYLDRTSPNIDQGTVSKINSRIISNKNLAIVARELNFDKYVFYGRSITNPLVDFSDKIWASFFEGFIGAIVNDYNNSDGDKIIDDIVENVIIVKAKRDQLLTKDNDYKTQLQEYLKRINSSVSIVYKTVSENHQNKKNTFKEAIIINGKTVISSTGSKKIDIHQKIAKIYINKLKSEIEQDIV